MKHPFKILGIEHIGIAVRDTRKGYKFLKNILGISNTHTEKIIDQGVITDIFKTRAGKIELLKPIQKASPINRFLEKRGEGMHHIAFLVDNLKAALKYLNENDINLIDSKPRVGAEGYKIAFINPKDTFGVLIELCEKI